MSLFVRKSGIKGWKLIHKSGDGKQRVISKSGMEFAELGFRQSMNLEEARAHCRPIQSEKKLAIQAERRGKIEARLKQTRVQASAWLPDNIVHEFEADVLPYKAHPEKPHEWALAKEIISSLNYPPSEWYFKPEPIFKPFELKGLGLDYIQRVLRLINIYGAYYSHKRKTSFYPIEMPSKNLKEKILRAFHSKGASRQVYALTNEALDAARPKLTNKNYNWLYLTVWLGLRPREVDQLIKSNTPKYWKIDTSDKRFTIIRVFQRKLQEKGVEDAKCWKAIPLVEPEQEKCVEIIKSQEFKRPLLKTVHTHISDKISLRSGRRYFRTLMRLRGYSDNITWRWMGHLNPKTSQEHYDLHDVVWYEKPKKVS